MDINYSGRVALSQELYNEIVMMLLSGLTTRPPEPKLLFRFIYFYIRLLRALLVEFAMPLLLELGFDLLVIKILHGGKFNQLRTPANTLL